MNAAAAGSSSLQPVVCRSRSFRSAPATRGRPGRQPRPAAATPRPLAHPTAPPPPRPLPQASGAATTFCVGLAFRTEHYTHKSALKVLIVGMGVVIASYGDVRANFVGVAMQVGSIVCDAVRCTLLQLAMQHSEVKLTPVGTLYHVAPMAALILSIPAVLTDGPKLMRHTAPIPYGWLAISCLAASSLNLVVFTLIGKTSALTTSVTGPLKEWVCILTSMAIYGSPVTAQQWIGYAIALCGIFWYQRDKFFAPPPAAPAAPAPAVAVAKEQKLPLLGGDPKDRDS
jgi:hypothetical protein